MEWARIVITDPITWWERCKWLEENSDLYYDDTEWAGWQIGISDIIYYVPPKTALIYYLKWT